MADRDRLSDRELEMALTDLFDEVLDEDPSLERLLALLDDDRPAVEVTVGEVADPHEELVAVRSAGTVEDHQVVVRGGWADVVLDIVSAGDGVVDVRGSVVGCDEVCSVQLLRDDDELAITTTDELGEFVLTGVPVGACQLIVAGDRREVSTKLELA